MVENSMPSCWRDEIAVEIVDLAAMKIGFAKMRPQKGAIIVTGHETDLLAVDFVRDLQA